MNQPSDAIGEQNVDLSWLDQRGYLAGSPDWVAHRLAGAVSARAIVRFAVHSLRATLGQFGAVGKRATSATLRAGNSGD